MGPLAELMHRSGKTRAALSHLQLPVKWFNFALNETHCTGKHGNRLGRKCSPGMNSIMGLVDVVPPAKDRWGSQFGVKGQRGISHPHRCQHKHNIPAFMKN